ncbi:MAG: DUF366 family protein, partial [Planctomycetes bacterium]|nr:DUF366 family protein [Planctomycetota bacterium]
MKFHWTSKPIKYDGSPLTSLWAFQKFGIQGDSIVAFKGGCDIPFENMVDIEDLRTKSQIRGDLMLHFIAEHFELDLEKTILRQRLLVILAKEIIETKSRKVLVRQGDDLYVKNGKLSISIATLSPVSGKIHLGLNITNKGTPVKTACLKDLRIEPRSFALN